MATETAVQWLVKNTPVRTDDTRATRIGLGQSPTQKFIVTYTFAGAAQASSQAFVKVGPASSIWREWHLVAKVHGLADSPAVPIKFGGFLPSRGDAREFQTKENCPTGDLTGGLIYQFAKGDFLSNVFEGLTEQHRLKVLKNLAKVINTIHVIKSAKTAGRPRQLFNRFLFPNFTALLDDTSQTATALDPERLSIMSDNDTIQKPKAFRCKGLKITRKEKLRRRVMLEDDHGFVRIVAKATPKIIDGSNIGDPWSEEYAITPTELRCSMWNQPLKAILESMGARAPKDPGGNLEFQGHSFPSPVNALRKLLAQDAREVKASFAHCDTHFDNVVVNNLQEVTLIDWGEATEWGPQSYDYVKPLFGLRKLIAVKLKEPDRILQAERFLRNEEAEKAGLPKEVVALADCSRVFQRAAEYQVGKRDLELSTLILGLAHLKWSANPGGISPMEASAGLVAAAYSAKELV